MSDLIDDQELQRLLDGALPADQRVLLLQYAEDHPANWRRISLAFIEEQILRSELKDLEILGAEVFEAEVFEAGHSDPALQTAEPAPHASHPWTGVLAQAAVVCLMLGAAVWMGRMSVDRTPSQAIGQTNVGQTNVAGQTNMDEATSAGDYTIVLTPELPASSTGAGRMARAGSQDQQDVMERMFTPLFDQQSRLMFRDHGYTVNEEPVIYVVQGRQGEQYVMPRRNVSLVAHRE